MAIVEWWYNSSYHTSIGMSPFEALYDLKPTHLGESWVVDTIKNGATGDMIVERRKIDDILKKILTAALGFRV